MRYASANFVTDSAATSHAAPGIPSSNTPQPPGAPWVFTYSAYKPWLAAMNNRLR